MQAADRAGRLLEIQPLGGRAVAAATLDSQQHLERAAARQVRDDVIRIDDFDVVVTGDIAGRDWPRAGLEQRQFVTRPIMHADRDGLEIQQNLDDVFLHALKARVLVQYRVDVGLDNRGTGHARKQHTS